MWLVEIAVNISAFVFLIALSVNRHAEKYFWISYVFVAVDLLVIVLVLYSSILKLHAVRKIPALLPVSTANRIVTDSNPVTNQL